MSAPGKTAQKLTGPTVCRVLLSEPPRHHLSVVAEQDGASPTGRCILDGAEGFSFTRAAASG